MRLTFDSCEITDMGQLVRLLLGIETEAKKEGTKYIILDDIFIPIEPKKGRS